MNLAKLFETQRILDNRIYDRFPDLKEQNNLDWKILALLVELGECANEWRGFKKWSEDQDPRLEVKCHACDGLGEFHHQVFSGNEHVDDKVEGCMYCGGTGIQERPLLEEYVDCLHFILSIGNEFKFNKNPSIAIVPNNVLDQFTDLFKIVSYMHDLYKDGGYSCGVHDYYDDLLVHFINLCKLLGFTWEQVEQAYYAKNAINHQRQEEGY